MTGQHSPEPWQYVLQDNCIVGVGNNYSDLLEIVPISRNTGIETRIANAIRIVSCVNACAGIADQESTVPTLLADNARMREQLQELVYALSAPSRQFSDVTRKEMEPWTVLARAALDAGKETTNG